MIMFRKISLYAKLISVGDNVWLVSSVGFIAHDVTHYYGHKYTGKIGYIVKSVITYLSGRV